MQKLIEKLKRAIGEMRAGFRSWRKRALLEASYQIFRLRLDKQAASREITAVILTCNPNPLFEKCLNSVKAQTLPASKIEIIEDTYPVSKAEQLGVDRVGTKYYVSVDADMVLDRTFFEKLYFLIRQNPQNALATLPVHDPILGRILAGGRMYLTNPVKKIGYHPFEGARDHDRYMSKNLQAKGYQKVIGPWISGQHHPVYLPHEAYWKFRVNAEKARYYGDQYPCFRDLADSIMEYWKQTHNDAALYALAGLFEGLKSDEIDGELSYDGRLNDPVFLKIKSFLDQPKNKNAIC